MKYINGKFYVEVKDHRYEIHPTESNILRLRDEPKSLGTQYQVQNETQIRRTQKVIKKDNNELIVKKIILKMNNQFNNNQKLVLLHVLVVREIFG